MGGRPREAHRQDNRPTGKGKEAWVLGVRTAGLRAVSGGAAGIRIGGGPPRAPSQAPSQMGREVWGGGGLERPLARQA